MKHWLESFQVAATGLVEKLRGRTKPVSFFFCLEFSIFSPLCWVYMSSAQKALSFFFIPLIRILNMLMYSCIFFYHHVLVGNLLEQLLISCACCCFAYFSLDRSAIMSALASLIYCMTINVWCILPQVPHLDSDMCTAYGRLGVERHVFGTV